MNIGRLSWNNTLRFFFGLNQDGFRCCSFLHIYLAAAARAAAKRSQADSSQTVYIGSLAQLEALSSSSSRWATDLVIAGRVAS